MRTLLALPALLLSSNAFAWGHLGHVWAYDEMPIPYQVIETDRYAGFDFPFLYDAMEEGFQNWVDGAPCNDFRAEVTGSVPESEYTGYRDDGRNLIMFDDKDFDISEPGTLAATLTRSDNRIERIISGTAYRPARDSDIVFNNDVRFIAADQIGGGCNNEPALEAVATHEIGHSLGLAHSCERGDPCTDAKLRSATMYWQADNCDATLAQPNEDDIDSITALYGPSATFQCSNELEPGQPDTLAVGIVPFTLRCSVTSDNFREITGATWSWGDGESSEEVLGTHVYEEPGNYTIRVCFQGERAACGAWEFCYKRPAYVRACGKPTPSFLVEGVEGLTYRFLNETDLSVYGCINDLQWDIYEGDEASGEKVDSVTAWEPDYTFPSSGRYTVVLNVGGPGGIAAAKLSFDARNVGDPEACSHVGGSSLTLGALAGLLALGRRRRRS